MDDKILKISENVSWVGVLDKDLETFDIVLKTEYGTTYNSYFIDAKYPTIVETVKEKFFDIYLNKIKQITNPSNIKYIVVNHTEPDHSGSIKQLIKLAPEATVVGSRVAISYLEEQIGESFKNIPIKDNDELDLGDKKIRFINAPNLHWPDSIYSYLESDKILFTCDSFGCHYCDEKMFDDLVGNFDDAFKYYFDMILRPFSKFMLKAIEKIKDLPINVIATGHGPILRSNWQKYVNLSKEYSLEEINAKKNNRVLITYVSAYQYTAKYAKYIAEGILEAGNFEVDLCDIERLDNHILNQKITVASGIIVGSPTLNQNTLPQIYQLFATINPIRDRGKLAAAFGSYGWSGESEKIITSNLANLKLILFERTLFEKFSPKNNNEEKYRKFGYDFAKKLETICINKE